MCQPGLTHWPLRYTRVSVTGLAFMPSSLTHPLFCYHSEHRMPTRHTRGFRSVVHRSDHFGNHGERLGIIVEEEYEEFADIFLGTPCPATARQFTRPWNGDLVRYDEGMDVFGILDCDRFIKTCYRPDPVYHGEASNLEYYLSEEAKT